jgi:dTDP-4-dehydrorhamnose 3,5-epimerase
MRFRDTDFAGVVQVDVEPLSDARGSFARFHCEREFAERGMAAHLVQTSVSRTTRRGTVRGMHFQWPPAQESKLIRCIRGRIYDAVIDLRPGSASFGRYIALELSAEDCAAIYVPPGLAHGFQTLEDDCEVLYQMGDFFAPDLSSGVRWDDPAFGIAWPLPCTAIHERDAAYPDFDPVQFSRIVDDRGGWGAIP